MIELNWINIIQGILILNSLIIFGIIIIKLLEKNEVKN